MAAWRKHGRLEAHRELQTVTMAEACAGASERLRRPYLLTSVPRIAKARIVWLLVLALSAVLTVQVLELFEATLSQQVALAWELAQSPCVIPIPGARLGFEPEYPCPPPRS